MKKTVKKTVKKAVKKTEKKAATKKTPAKSAAAKKISTDLLEIVMKSLDQDKGQDIISIDLSGKTSIADHMVIATGTSSRHVSSLAEKLKDRLRKEGILARIEGKSAGDWVVVDGGAIIAHLFRQEVRDFYNLEKLWDADFSTVDYTVYKKT